MKPTGLFYSFNTRHTSAIAEKIAKELGESNVEKINIETVDPETFQAYDSLILGVSTWFDGELPNYWDEFLPAMEDMDFTGKTVALFGPADQVGYPQNFADAIGILADYLKKRGATLVGFFPAEGYRFLRSRALEGDHFMGLVLDDGNQPELTEKRIREWCLALKKSFIKS
ncbi:MAG: flavodoxin [Bacteroidales bacterium]|nr:flavodoxin [Lentimicrobiaceae bacterium]MDD5694508.1 flavodoxin [Bacteroidales bacterium]